MIFRKLFAAKRHHQISLLWMLSRFLTLKAKRNFNVQEMVGRDMFNPQIPIEVVLGSFREKEFKKLLANMNPGWMLGVTGDKSVFYNICERYNIPVPKVLAVATLPTGWVATGKILHCREDWIAFIEHDLPSEVFVKNSLGWFGMDAQRYRRSNSSFIDGDRKTVSASDIYERMLNVVNGPFEYAFYAEVAQFRKFVFQEVIKNHSSILKLSGSQGVSTARIATLVGKDGKVELVGPHAFRLASGENITDHFRGGKCGNLTIPMGDDGILRAGMSSKNGGMSYQFVDHHPETGERITGFQLPEWTKAIEMVKHAALCFSPIRCLGWDVAFTDQGPLIVETNANWGLKYDLGFQKKDWEQKFQDASI